MDASIVRQAAEVLAPFGNGSDPSTVRAFTLQAGAYAVEVPESWWGCYVIMKALDADAYFFFSEQDDVLPDASKAASTSGGADAQLGWRLRDGEVEEMLIPSPTPGTNPRGPVYLCVDGSDAGVLWMRKSGRK